MPLHAWEMKRGWDRGSDGNEKHTPPAQTNKQIPMHWLGPNNQKKKKKKKNYELGLKNLEAMG